MEIFNTLPEDRIQEIEDFLTFIPIYNSKRREKAYRSLLKKHLGQIKGKTVCEAGAGRGIFSEYMLELGAEKVYAVERSDAMLKILEATASKTEQLEIVPGYIEDFEPEQAIDLLLHEFYGPLVLDETILALRDLSFQPGTLLPDGGRLWAMPLSEATIREKISFYDPSWKEVLKDVLVSEFINPFTFEPKWEIFSWDVHSEETSFTFEVPEACDFLVFCGEITHQGEGVLKMWWTNNWPLIFTPVRGDRCTFRFEYIDGFTDIFFEWA